MISISRREFLPRIAIYQNSGRRFSSFVPQTINFLSLSGLWIDNQVCCSFALLKGVVYDQHCGVLAAYKLLLWICRPEHLKTVHNCIGNLYSKPLKFYDICNRVILGLPSRNHRFWHTQFYCDNQKTTNWCPHGILARNHHLFTGVVNLIESQILAFWMNFHLHFNNSSSILDLNSLSKLK